MSRQARIKGKGEMEGRHWAEGGGGAAVWTSVHYVDSSLSRTECLGFHQFLSEEETGN